VAKCNPTNRSLALYGTIGMFGFTTVLRANWRETNIRTLTRPAASTNDYLTEFDGHLQVARAPINGSWDVKNLEENDDCASEEEIRKAPRRRQKRSPPPSPILFSPPA